MTIVHLITSRQLRGAEVFAVQLAEFQVARGHTVHVISLYPSAGHSLEAAVTSVTDLNERKSTLNFALLRRLGSLFKQFRPDVIQANGADTLKYAVLAKIMGSTHAPVVYRNISIASAWLNGSLQQRVYRYLFSKVGAVAAVSKRSADDLAATYSIPPSRIMVIPVGTLEPAKQSDKAAAVLQSLGIRDENTLLHVGSFTPEKNHVGLLSIFKVAKKRLPDLKLVLIGDGPLRSVVESKVETEGLNDVYLLGHQQVASTFLRHVKLLLLPSLIEGIPGVILEACAYGVPSIAYRVGSIDEAIRDDESGMLIAVGDENRFADGIVTLIQDDARRRQMGEKAYEIFQRHFRFDLIGEKFFDLYASVIRR